jgi:hypothetical protein
MPRIDDYIAARVLARERLNAIAYEALLNRSGFDGLEGTAFRVPFLNRVFRLSYPDFEFSDLAAPQQEVPLQEQVLILHYLQGDPPPWADGGDWVAYREIPGAAFYFAAFRKRALDPLKNVFGQNVAGLKTAAARLNGDPVGFGDAGFEFRVFPKVPVRLILYAGDEEFPAEASILFDRSIDRMLSPEDIAWLAGMLVYRLMSLSRETAS